MSTKLQKFRETREIAADFYFFAWFGQLLPVRLELLPRKAAAEKAEADARAAAEAKAAAEARRLPASSQSFLSIFLIVFNFLFRIELAKGT